MHELDTVWPHSLPTTGVPTSAAHHGHAQAPYPRLARPSPDFPPCQVLFPRLITLAAFSTLQALPFFYTSKSHSSFKAFLQWHLLRAALTKSHTQSNSRAPTASSKGSIRAAVPLFWGDLLVYLAVQVVSSLRPGIECLPLSIFGLNTVPGTSSVHKHSSHL